MQKRLCMRIRKILAHDTDMRKNPQNKEDNLWIFKYFHGVMRVQSPTSARKFISGVANPKIVYMLIRFQVIYIDGFLF